MQGFLERSFPAYTFKVGDNPELRGAGFSLFPVLGVAGDGEASRMVSPPPRSTMREIEEALRNAFGRPNLQ